MADGAIDFQCCFCGSSIARVGPDPVALVIPMADGGTQDLRCHLACLREALHPSVPLGVFEDGGPAAPGTSIEGRRGG
jgi:hypothetical protein